MIRLVPNVLKRVSGREAAGKDKHFAMAFGDGVSPVAILQSEGIHYAAHRTSMWDLSPEAERASFDLFPTGPGGLTGCVPYTSSPDHGVSLLSSSSHKIKKIRFKFQRPN